MSRWYVCDHCEAEQQEPFPFELTQINDELDDDGDQTVEIHHFCSAACLCGRSMELAMDYPESDAQTDS